MYGEIGYPLLLTVRVEPSLERLEVNVPTHDTAPSTAIFSVRLHVFVVAFNHGALETTGDPDCGALQR